MTRSDEMPCSQRPQIDFPVSPHVLSSRTLLYEPLPEDIVGKSGLRKIFCNTPLSATENTWLAEFREELKAQNIQLDPADEKEYLRYLQHSKGKVSETLKMLRMREEFREQFFKDMSDTSILDDLRSGFLYIHGRDRKERPILVMRLAKLGNMEDFGPDDMMRLVGFVLEWMIRYALVPGRVENWLVIVDVKDVSLRTISRRLDVIKKMATAINMNYRFRNTYVMIFDAPLVGRGTYKLISVVLPQDTRNKVNFVSSTSSNAKKLIESMVEPHQLEERFGGEAPNCEEPEDFYPFRFFPSTSSSDIQERMPEQYPASGYLCEEGQSCWKHLLVNDFWTPSSSSHWNEKFGLKLTPAVTLDSHLSTISDLLNPKRRVSIISTPSVATGMMTDKEEYRIEMCRQIAGLVNEDNLESAISVVRNHDDWTAKKSRNKSMRSEDLFHIVEFRRPAFLSSPLDSCLSEVEDVTPKWIPAGDTVTRKHQK